MGTRLIRLLTSWAWRPEIDFHKSAMIIQELHAKPGAIEARIKNDPAIAEWTAQCFAAMLKDAPNYMELKFDLVALQKDPPEWITVTIQRGMGRTPHELKREAEEKLKATLAKVQMLEASANNTNG